MNANGRKTIRKMIEQLVEMSGELEQMAAEEHEKFENLPEGLQGSERGEAYERSAEALENAFDMNISDLISSLEEAIE